MYVDYIENEQELNGIKNSFVEHDVHITKEMAEALYDALKQYNDEMYKFGCMGDYYQFANSELEEIMEKAEISYLEAVEQKYSNAYTIREYERRSALIKYYYNLLESILKIN